MNVIIFVQGISRKYFLGKNEKFNIFLVIVDIIVHNFM
jgi:hypothetical protein